MQETKPRLIKVASASHQAPQAPNTKDGTRTYKLFITCRSAHAPLLAHRWFGSRQQVAPDGGRFVCTERVESEGSSRQLPGRHARAPRVLQGSEMRGCFGVWTRRGGGCWLGMQSVVAADIREQESWGALAACMGGTIAWHHEAPCACGMCVLPQSGQTHIYCAGWV